MLPDPVHLPASCYDSGRRVVQVVGAPRVASSPVPAWPASRVPRSLLLMFPFASGVYLSLTCIFVFGAGGVLWLCFDSVFFFFFFSGFCMVRCDLSATPSTSVHGVSQHTRVAPDVDSRAVLRAARKLCLGSSARVRGSLRCCPPQVAAKIVRGLKSGDFCITFGTDGYFLGLGTAGFSPCFSIFPAFVQVWQVFHGGKRAVCCALVGGPALLLCAAMYWSRHFFSKR